MQARQRKRAAIVVGALGLGCSGPALAQQGGAPSGAGSPQAASGDIVVTARRVEERLQDVPISTYAYENPALRASFGGVDYGVLPAFALLNLNLNVNQMASLPIDLALFATNVLGKRYYTYVPGLGPTGFETAQIGQPRMYGVRLRYRFGR